MYDFSVDDNAIKITTIADIRKYLMKKNKNKFFRLFKQLVLANH